MPRNNEHRRWGSTFRVVVRLYPEPQSLSAGGENDRLTYVWPVIGCKSIQPPMALQETSDPHPVVSCCHKVLFSCLVWDFFFSLSFSLPSSSTLSTLKRSIPRLWLTPLVVTTTTFNSLINNPHSQWLAVSFSHTTLARFLGLRWTAAHSFFWGQLRNMRQKRRFADTVSRLEFVCRGILGS